jgi:hypothetical protein
MKTTVKDENKKDRNNYLFKYIENKSLNGARNFIYGELSSGKFNFTLYLLGLPPFSCTLFWFSLGENSDTRCPQTEKAVVADFL